MTKPIQENIDDTRPVETWFIERTGDGFIFATNEEDAFEIIHNPTSWRRRDFKIIGVSDGTVFHSKVKNSTKKVAELKERFDELTKTLNKYRATEERFVFEEVLDDTDEKLIRVREKIQKIESELEPLEVKMKQGKKSIVDDAFQAELKVARGNIKMPRNKAVITPQGQDRKKIMQQMGL